MKETQMKETQMQEIHLKEIQRITKFLEAIDCKYVIAAPDGSQYQHGLVATETKARTRAPLRYAYGTISSWYKPYLNLAAPLGSVQIVPIGEFPATDVRRGVSSYLTREWGVDSYVTNLKSDGIIEVLRTCDGSTKG